MSNNITNADYVKILDYYKIKIPRSDRLLQKTAENIMADKLCRCIKKLDPVNESRSIGICTKSIFNKKGLKRENFTCKGKRKVAFSKNTNNKKNTKNTKKRYLKK
jgi:hypothetical protein